MQKLIALIKLHCEAGTILEHMDLFDEAEFLIGFEEYSRESRERLLVAMTETKGDSCNNVTKRIKLIPRATLPSDEELEKIWAEGKEYKTILQLADAIIKDIDLIQKKRGPIILMEEVCIFGNATLIKNIIQDGLIGDES